MNAIGRRWPEDANGRVPCWVYSDPEVYREELKRIWYGPHWLYCGLEAEIPEVGDFKTTTLGERPVVLVRSAAGEISVFENRCRHRGLKFCQTRFGQAKELLCPHHQWTYDLKGNLIRVPFRRGVRRRGMPADFDPKAFGLHKVRVEVVNGVVWASFSTETRPFREYLGERFWEHFTRIYDGRKLSVLGYHRQHIPANWKLVQENDPTGANAKRSQTDVKLITVFPSVILQHDLNSLATRQIVPTGSHGFDLHSTHWCYADDTPEMRLRRTRQASLFCPSGFLPADNVEVMADAQQGFAAAPDNSALVTMAGYRAIENTPHMVPGAAIRGMYRYWREVMDL